MTRFIDDNSIDRISLLKLRYFLVVAQMEHITQASTVLQITQPALSRAISSMEKDIGVSLFTRCGNHISLNHYGKALKELAEQTLSSFAAIQQNAQNSSNLSGTVKFMTSIISNKHLTKLIKDFHSLYPGISFDVSTMHPYNNIEKAVDISDWDLFIHSSAIPMYKCISIPIFSERFLLGVSESHPLAEQGHISLSQCSNDPFISLREKTSYYKETYNLCISSGFQPNIICHCDNTNIAMDLASQGVGVVIIPEASWGFTPENLRLLILDNQDSNRAYYISRFREKNLSPASALFYDFALEYFSNL